MSSENKSVINKKKLFQDVENVEGDSVYKALGAENIDNKANVLQYGPLNKNLYTYRLEFILKALLSGEKIEFKKETNHKITAVHQGNVYNLSEILENANFNHIEFSIDNFNQYVDFLSKTPLWSPTSGSGKQTSLAADKPFEWLENIFKERAEKLGSQNSLENLSLAEKLAINIYTSDFSYTANALLRGLDFTETSLPFKKENINANFSRTVKELLLTSAVAMLGLNKHIEDIPAYAVRQDNITPNNGNQHLEKKISAANHKDGVVFEKGFISAAQKKSAYTSILEGNAATIFSHLKGMDVRALSQMPQEQEFLIPATQIQWIKHEEIDGKHVFLAKPVTVLNGIENTVTIDNTISDSMLESDNNADSTDSIPYSANNTAYLNDLNNNNNNNNNNNKLNDIKKLAYLHSALLNIKQNYAFLKKNKGIHLKQINDLYKKSLGSSDFTSAVNMLETAYAKEEKKYTASFFNKLLKLFRKTPKNFAEQLNAKQKTYHYPRGLGLILKDIYTAFPDYPSTLSPASVQEINQIQAASQKSVLSDSKNLFDENIESHQEKDNTEPAEKKPETTPVSHPDSENKLLNDQTHRLTTQLEMAQKETFPNAVSLYPMDEYPLSESDFTAKESYANEKKDIKKSSQQTPAATPINAAKDPVILPPLPSSQNLRKA